MRYFKREDEYYGFSSKYLEENPSIILEYEEVTLSQVEEATQNRNYLKPLTRKQFKLLLLRNGYYELVESYIRDSEDHVLKINYQEALFFDRRDPLVVQVAEALNVDEDFLNEKWKEGLMIQESDLE